MQIRARVSASGSRTGPEAYRPSTQFLFHARDLLKRVGCEHRAPMEEIVMGIDLEQARRRAKELLRVARAGDPDALARMRHDRAPRLTDAQRAVAAELGFASWPTLVDHLQTAVGDRSERRARLVIAALNGRADVAERLLGHDPALADAGLDAALVLGKHDRVAAALDRDPKLVGRDLPIFQESVENRCRAPATRYSSVRPHQALRVCGR